MRKLWETPKVRLDYKSTVLLNEGDLNAPLCCLFNILLVLCCF